jgi:hypothetical protein
MRIYDTKNNKALNNVIIMVTPSETKQLIDFLKSLTSNIGEHIHVEDYELVHEITFAIYTPENQHTFAPRIVQLIEEDK